VRGRGGEGGGLGLGFDPINKDESWTEEGLFKAKAVKEVDDRRRRRTEETFISSKCFFGRL